MDQKYIELFQEIAHATEVLAERVQDVEYNGKTEESQRAAQILHKDYSELYDKLRNNSFTTADMTRADFIKLLVGTNIVTGNIATQVKNMQNAIDGYNTKIMPLLNKIYEETTDDESARALADELFQITDNQ